MRTSRRVLVGWLGAGCAALVVASGCGSSESGGTAATEDGGTPASTTIDAGTGTPDAAKPDAAKADAGPACGPLEELCGTTCIDTSSDPENCGGCGETCTAVQECTGGACVDLCPSPAPDASFTSAPATVYVNGEVTFTPALTTGVTYAWTFPSGTPATSTAMEPKVTWSAPGTYAVKLEITQGKCVTTTTVDITVAACGGSAELEYTGAVQDFVVPCGTSIHIDAYGAEGGTGTRSDGSAAGGGLGGRAEADVAVTAGETLHVYVGGRGQDIGTGPTPGVGTGGFNGGGEVYDFVPNPSQSEGPSGTGGGASDVRRGAALDGRLVVAGGGGGGGYYGNGGAGGGLVGADGNSSAADREPGKGGTQSAGGAVGWSLAPNYQNTAGELGVGGKAYRDGAGNGGGGGGYYGGGTGGFCGGAGGSSYVAAAGNTNGTTTPGVRTGNGRVVITW